MVAGRWPLAAHVPLPHHSAMEKKLLPVWGSIYNSKRLASALFVTASDVALAGRLVSVHRQQQLAKYCVLTGPVTVLSACDNRCSFVCPGPVGGMVGQAAIGNHLPDYWTPGPPYRCVTFRPPIPTQPTPSSPRSFHLPPPLQDVHISDRPSFPVPRMLSFAPSLSRWRSWRACHGRRPLSTFIRG